MIEAGLAGFLLGFSLIMAIGAQNAFVLRQGLRGDYVLSLVLTCALSDALLITAGVAGFGALIAANPWALNLVRWAGAAFLFVYGAMNFRAAWVGGGKLEDKGGTAGSLKGAISTCLLLTWANPHVYLDTVVLLGGISAQYELQWAFGVGAAISSFVFFFMLGFGARFLRPVFTSARAWRTLDVFVGITMWAIATKLVIGV
ncbi:LysE/ArgO family amino acid transporter [Shimia abyssi]|uniref:L-lysine exporter family protein LysE/ArgO n=1 Tax=Shimia abyssi TaxID=1662395 RepID=A0A2P8FK31_9RHOB|nr:LysE/ArgO family amino acid transporter [Shimia abyssi]PSL22091.1 L-lysine exporter family protein LysE/ArgO [Shimia abyssi]